MIVHNNPKFSIYFGDTKTSPFTIEKFRALKFDNKQELENDLQKQFLSIKNSFKNIVFLNQVHGNDGYIIDSTQPSLQTIKILNEGDYLITDQKNVAIGILTADCLPIIYYDKAKDICAIAHAGWKGTIKNIATKVIEQMKQNFKSEEKDIDIFFGPNAKICCYEVSCDFEQNIQDKNLALNSLKKIHSKTYFDIPLYNQIILEKSGIKNINFGYNICTICMPNFCSHRKEKEKSGLQMTIVALNS